MNLNEKLNALLGKTGLEIEQDEYTGKKDQYIIYTYENERPGSFGDNSPTSDTAYVQIQLITPKNFNYFELKTKIRNLLEDADFLVLSTRSFLGSVYTGTEKIRQTVFEVSYTEMRMEE